MEQSLNQALSKEAPCDMETAGRGLEEVWVQACRSGDTRSFNRLVLKWEKPIYNLALRMLQDREEAAETTQEVFCSAFKNIGKFRQDAKFSTWLYRIAVNHCISRLRKRPPGIHMSIDDQSPEAPLKGWSPARESHEAELLQDETRRRIRQALTNLPEDQRAVVELKFFQDLTFEEIASVIQVPLSTVKSRLYAGLELMKTRLGRTSAI